MITTILTTADEFAVLDVPGRRFDLIRGMVHGMPAAGAEHGELISEFNRLIAYHVVEHHLGKTYAAETASRLSSDRTPCSHRMTPSCA